MPWLRQAYRVKLLLFLSGMGRGGFSLLSTLHHQAVRSNTVKATRRQHRPAIKARTVPSEWKPCLQYVRDESTS